MIALFRLLVIGFVVLTVIYVCVSLYSRSVRRSKLNAAWEAGDRDGDWRVDGADATGPYQDRDSYMQAGMAQYDASLRKKLILGVYVIPAVIVAFIIYATNFM